MGSRVAGKIKLQSVDELLGVPEIAGTQEIELGRIHSFPNHPFKVLDDEKNGYSGRKYQGKWYFEPCNCKTRSER